jgi:hypothetical protein
MGDAKADTEALMNAVLPFAERMLTQHGEFFPFGAAMKPNGEIVNVAGYDGRERPASNDLIELLNDGFCKDAKNGRYKATAVVYDVRVTLPNTTTKSDAIAVSLDHRDSYSVLVLLPYSLTGGTLRIGEPLAEKGEHKIFKRFGH